MIYPFKDKTPKIDPSVFIADYATVTGDVTIGAETTIWFNTVIRGDVSQRLSVNVSVFRIFAVYTKAQNIRSLLKMR